MPHGDEQRPGECPLRLIRQDRHQDHAPCTVLKRFDYIAINSLTQKSTKKKTDLILESIRCYDIEADQRFKMDAMMGYMVFQKAHHQNRSRIVCPSERERRGG